MTRVVAKSVGSTLVIEARDHGKPIVSHGHFKARISMWCDASKL